MTYEDIPPSVEGSTKGTPRGCRRPRGVSPRGVPEVDPDTQGRNNPCARAWTKVLALLFERREAVIRMSKAPLGMLVNYMLITPRDDCPIRKVMCSVICTARAAFEVKSSVNTFSGAVVG